jgi:hypothetical protein
MPQNPRKTIKVKTTIIEKELVYEINGCVFEVYKELGHAFLEKFMRMLL